MDAVVAAALPGWSAGMSAARDLAQHPAGLSMVRLSTPAETATSILLAGRAGRALGAALDLTGLGTPLGTDRCLLLVGLLGTTREARRAAADVRRVVRRHRGAYLGGPLGRHWRRDRFRTPYLRDRLWELGYGVDTVETATWWSRVPALVRALEDALRSAGPGPVHVGTHLSHVYPSGSSVYTTFVFRLGTIAGVDAGPLGAADVGGPPRGHRGGRDDQPPARRRRAPPRRARGREGTGRHRRPARGRAVGRPGRRHEPGEAAAMTGLRWDPEWREAAWAGLDRPWDLVVVGGGITGAGVLRAAARSGLRALLLERDDFSSGASSRSSQLVHGGLRYLAQGHVGVTRDAVRARERLLREAPGLVAPLPTVLPLHAGRRGQELTYRAALTVYEALAGRAGRLGLTAEDALLLAPALDRDGLRGALRYPEARTDDARLVLRVLRDAAALGAVAVNRVAVTDVVTARGRVRGVRVVDGPTGRTGEVRADVVVNATGAWADGLRDRVGAAPRMRPVAGSHLVLPGWRFPLALCVNVRSPRDGRYVSVFPWEGATVVGTTDVDGATLDAEPAITGGEAAYLLECVTTAFPSLGLTASDVLSTWSGVRPIVSSGLRSSGEELREHVVWDEQGMLTATGGKLTTFEVAAERVLRAAAPHLARAPGPPRAPRAPRRSRGSAVATGRSPGARDRVVARHGPEAAAVLAAARPGEEAPIGATPVTRAELRWSAGHEAVTSLGDLLLRRTRLGLLLPDGGAAVLDDVLGICRDELGWDATRAATERRRYTDEVRRGYAPPAPAGT